MLRYVIVLGGALASSLYAAGASADALPHDPVSGKSINGASILFGLEDHPEYTFVRFDSECLSPDGPEGEGLLRTLGEHSTRCDYTLLSADTRYDGVPFDSPNAPSERFAALPAKDFSVRDGRIPALDRVTLGTLYAWLEGGDDSPLVDLGAPPGFVELHRFSKFASFTRHQRVTMRCGALTLAEIRTDWQLEDGGVVSRPAPPAPACEPEPAAALDPPVAPAEGPDAPPSPVQTVVAGAASVQTPPDAPAKSDGPGDRPEAAEPPPLPGPESSPTTDARDRVLGGVCLLVGLAAGFLLRRRSG